MKGKGKQGKGKNKKKDKKKTIKKHYHLDLCVTGDHSELELPASPSYPSLTAPACGVAVFKLSAVHQDDLKRCGETPPFGLGLRAMKY